MNNLIMAKLRNETAAYHAKLEVLPFFKALTDPARFPAAWIQAVNATLEQAGNPTESGA